MRLPVEERYNTYVEQYESWNGSGNGGYPFVLRDYVRTFSGSTSPEYPRKLRYNSLAVFSSKAEYRPAMPIFRQHADIPTAWDKLVIYYRDPTFVPPAAPYVFGSVDHEPTARGIAIGKAMDNAKDMKVNLAQFIAERKQLVNSLTRIVERLTLAHHNVRRRNYKGAMAALGLTKKPDKLQGNIAKDWLAFQYGWKPLLSDAKGLAEFFAKRNFDQTVRLVARGNYKVTSPAFSKAASFLGMYNACTYYWHPRVTEARTKLEFIVTNDLQRTSSELGISDPLLLAWELIPYSFVVDWFIPIGDFLGRLNYDSGLLYQGGCTTLHSVQVSEARTNPGEYINSQRMQAKLPASGVIKFTSLRLNRELHVTAPRPDLVGFEDPFTPTRFLNALALLRVAFERSRG